MKNFKLFEKCNRRIARRVTLIAVLLAMCMPQLWAWSGIKLRGDWMGGFSYTSDTWTYGGEGNKYWDVYHPGGTKYWRLHLDYFNHDVGPNTANYVLNVGTTGYKVVNTGDKAFKTTANAGILRIQTSQTYDGGEDERPNVWITRPTVKFKYDFENDGGDWTMVDATDNQDGTYTYRGRYCGINYFNAGPNDADKVHLAGDTPIGSPSAGDRCEFKWQPGTGDPNTDYKYTTDESHNYGIFTITKLCTITYYANGGTGDAPDPQEVLYGADQTLRGNTGSLAKTDYVFVGWNTASDGSGKHYDVGATLEDVEADVDLYAEWVSGKWGVKGKGGDGALGSDFETFHVLRKISTNKYKGSVSLGAHQVYEFKITDNTTWYGKSDIYKYFLGQTNTVNLETGGGSEKNCIIATGNAGDYTFEFDESTGGLIVTYPNGNNHPSTNFVYYSNPNSWGTIKAYIYDNPELTTWNNSPILGTPVTISGQSYYYTALGDRNDVIFQNGSGGQTDDLDEADDEVGHYYNTSWAQFTIRITLNNQSATSAGTEYKEVKFNYDELTTSIICPTKTGYNFGGYYTETNGGGVQIINASGVWQASVSGYTDGSKRWIMDGGNVTLYAKWTEKEWNVTAQVSPAGTGFASPSSATSYGEVTGGAISASNNTGYHFSTWSITSGSGSFTSAVTTASNTFNPTSATTLTATFVANTYDLDLDSEGGSSGSSSVTVTYNSSSHTAITNPTKTGYTFGGWYDGDDGTGNLVINTSGVLQANVSTLTGADGIWIKDGTPTLYAKWTPQTYNITYNDKNGSGGDCSGSMYSTAPSTHTYASETSLQRAYKSGYTFDGWYTKSDCSSGKINLTLGATDYTANINLYAKWATASLNTLENNTLYGASEMVPIGITVGSEQYCPGVSENNRFDNIGVGAAFNSTATDGTPMTSKTLSSTEVGDQSFTKTMYFKKAAASASSSGKTLPTSHAMHFAISGNGKLDIYCKKPQKVYLIKSGSSTEQLNNSLTGNQKITKTVSSGEYYIYATEGSTNLYGLRFRQQYTITHTLSNVTTSSPTVAFTGEAYEATFAADTHYSLPGTVTVMRGETNITGNCTWSSGTLTIPAAQVTGNIMITVTGVIDTYTVTFAPNNGDYGSVSPTSIASVPHGSTVSIDGSTNVLTLNGTNVTPTPTAATAQYTYAFDSWSVSDDDEITSDTEITATFTRTLNSYSVSATLAQCAVKAGSDDIPATMHYGDDLSTVIQATAGYTLPSTITVTGVKSYTWDQATGELTLTDVTGAVSISITAELACVTPAAPTISGTTAYTYGGTITLTASHDGDNHDASTTYRWLKGASFAGAVQVQAAATGLSGYTFTKTAVLDDAGTYWCEASNGETCKSHNSTGYAITVGKASISPTLTYTSTSLTTGDVTGTPSVGGNPGSGAVSYEVTASSPSGCITVDDETGVVTAVAVGTGTVTATIEATDNYLGGTATADFTVSAPCFQFKSGTTKSGSAPKLPVAAGGSFSTSMWTAGDPVLTGGTLTNSSVNDEIDGNDKHGLVINSESKKVTVTLTSPSVFEAGTVIVIGAKVDKDAKSGASKTCGFTIGGNTPTPASKTSETAGELFEQTYTVEEGDGIDGTNRFEIALKSSANRTYLWSIKVTGCGEKACTEAELAYAVTEVAKTYGDAAFTNTLTNANSAVRYSSTVPAVAEVHATTGQVTIVGAGSTTIKAKIADDATYCDEEVSYTLNVAKAPIGVTATTGAATNVTQTSARLPINLSGTTANAASVTVKLYSSSDALIDTYASIATNATYKEVTGLTASTTYKYTITVIGDANHLNGTETAKQSFVTADPTYTITFAANGSDGGSAMTNVTDIVSGNDVDLAANTWTKTEHDFVGWKTNVALTYVPNSGGDPVNVAVDGIVPNEATIKNVTSNITLTAQWHAKVYNVYFFAGEDARAIDGYTTYEYGEQKAMPTNVIRTGYLFDGWYDNSEYTGDPLTQMPADATGNKYYYAKWHELSSKCLYITRDVITAYNAVAAAPGYYMYNDAKYVFGSGYDASASMLVLEAADGRSYVYLDPNIGEVKQVEVHISAIADKNVEDKGISWGFTNNEANVESVDLTDMDQITSNAFTFRPTDENKQFFVFKSLATTLSIDNICVFYEPQTYTVTYDKGEGATGTAPATATYNYNDVVTVEAGTALAKDGYTFRGWFDGTTFYVIGDKFKVTHNTTLNAVWQSDSGCEGRSVGSLFKMQVKTGLTNGTLANDDGNFCTLTTSNYLSTLKGGTARAQNKNEHTQITGTNAILLKDNDSYIEISLPSAIQAGDVLIYSGASGIEVDNVSEKPNTPQMAIAAGTNVTVIVGAESDLVGYSKIYMYRHNSSSTVTYFEVRRPVFYMSVGTPSATDFAKGETAITTSNGLAMLIGATATVGCKNAAGDMKFRGSSYYDLHFYNTTTGNGYLKLTLDNPLAEGDVLSFTCGSGNNQLAITTTDTYSATIQTSSKTYTIPALSSLIGESTIYLWNTGSQAYVKTLSIIRAADAVSGGGEAICHFTVSFACKTGFEALDGRLPENTVGVPDGAHIGAPEDPFAIGYAFLGWYDDAACSDGHEVDFETLTITENTTIYAKWENNVHTFTGAAETTAWETEGNWDAAGIPNSAYPYCYSQVYINAPAEIAKDTKAHVGRLDIVNDRSSYTGRLTIASGAMLIVYDKVSRITNWLTQERLATIAEDIYIGSERDDEASWREQGGLNGALIMGDYDRETQADSATVQFASLAYTKRTWTTSETSWGERDVNQYIGIPFAHAQVGDYVPYDIYTYTNVYLYEHDRWNNSWSPMSKKQDMSEFTGYDLVCFSLAPDDCTNPKPIFDLKGELASTAEERRIHLREYEGYYEAEENETMLANSWTAPIDIASFEVSDFENAEATIYMFNAGTSAEYDGNVGWANNYSTYPGQYTAIPLNDLKLHPYDYEGYKTIPSMQSFSIITLDDDGDYRTRHNNSYLTMDYKRLVYDPAVEAASVTTERMHAPRRVPTMEEEPLAIMLHVHGMSGMGDRIRILEREDFSYGRDNGWETSKLLGIIEAPSLYAVTEVGDQATVAVPDVEGLGLTFQAGEYDNVYTFNFEYDENEEPLYLLDKKTGIYTRVLTENTYSFVTTDKNFNERFLLTRNYQMPEVATGLENTNADPSQNERVQKVLINDMIYILRDGHIYDATGKMLK